MKKALIVALILGIVSAGFLGANGGTETGEAADGAAKTYQVAFIPTSVGQPVTNAWLEGMMRVFRNHPNVKVQSFDPQLRADLQVTYMDDVINQKYDAIVLQPQDAAALSAAVKSAESKGIFVISMNTAPIQAHTASVQMADIDAGYAVGMEMGKQLNGKGNVVIIQSPPGAILGVNREKGFRQAIEEKYPGIKIVGAQSAEGWKKEIAITIMNSFLQANSQLDGVFAVNDNMAEGAMIAAEAAGRLDKIKVWGANGQKSTLAFIEQGKMAGTAYNNSFDQGTLVANMIMERFEKNLGPAMVDTTPITRMPPFMATKETVGQIKVEDRW
jgi:ABC-type sugar transport system substrate-binding protein